MRILTLCYEFPPVGGGGGRVARTVAEGLVQRGHQVRVQTAALGFRSIREEVNGIEVFRTASGRKLPDTCTVPEMGAYVATSLVPTLRHIRQWQPQVLHAHFAMPTGALAWAASRLTGVPYVLTAHLGDVPGGVPEQTDKLFRYVGGAARRVWQDAAGATAVSGFVQELAERAYTLPVRRIPNGIALERRAPRLPRDPALPPQLVFLGRFNAQKNAPGLIESLALLQDLPWRLTMIGDGPDMPAVRASLTHHGLGERVELRGWQSSHEVEQALTAADILCMPSRSEGLPVAAVEALKAGLALAGTDIPGLRDVLAPGENGFATPLDDPTRYAQELRTLLSDGALLTRYQQASWQRAELFALPRIITAYEEVLQAATRRCRSRPV